MRPVWLHDAFRISEKYRQARSAAADNLVGHDVPNRIGTQIGASRLLSKHGGRGRAKHRVLIVIEKNGGSVGS